MSWTRLIDWFCCFCVKESHPVPIVQFFLTLFKWPLSSPPRFGHVCCNFFEWLFKKCVNVFCDLIRQNIAYICGKNVKLRDAFPFQNGWIFGKVPKGGGGHFQSKNLYCKIWTFKQVYVTMKLIQSVARLKNLQYNFPKMRGGSQRPFGTFPKIHPFWSC